MAQRCLAQVTDPKRRVRFTAGADWLRHTITYSDYCIPSAADSKSASLLRSFLQLPTNFQINIQDFFLHFVVAFANSLLDLFQNFFG